jgi:hypothetical protein
MELCTTVLTTRIYAVHPARQSGAAANLVELSETRT